MTRSNNVADKTVKTSSALTKLFNRQQPKVRANTRKQQLLLTFAEEDYKRIADLIKQWLATDEKKH